MIKNKNLENKINDFLLNMVDKPQEKKRIEENKKRKEIEKKEIEAREKLEFEKGDFLYFGYKIENISEVFLYLKKYLNDQIYMPIKSIVGVPIITILYNKFNEKEKGKIIYKMYKDSTEQKVILKKLYTSNQEKVLVLSIELNSEEYFCTLMNGNNILRGKIKENARAGMYSEIDCENLPEKLTIIMKPIIEKINYKYQPLCYSDNKPLF